MPLSLKAHLNQLLGKDTDITVLVRAHQSNSAYMTRHRSCQTVPDKLEETNENQRE